jgi:hypothetical protein
VAEEVGDCLGELDGEGVGREAAQLGRLLRRFGRSLRFGGGRLMLGTTVGGGHGRRMGEESQIERDDG